MKPPAIRFGEDEADAAAEAWGANCGPGALAAMTGKTLDEVRPFLDGFDRKRYINPTMMFGALKAMGVEWARCGAQFPMHGITRIQWHGPWTAPGVPMRVRYRHTHWVGAWRDSEREAIEIFDINAVTATGGWVPLGVWTNSLVPWLLNHCAPKADGEWSVTHGIEISPWW